MLGLSGINCKTHEGPGDQLTSPPPGHPGNIRGGKVEQPVALAQDERPPAGLPNKPSRQEQRGVVLTGRPGPSLSQRWSKTGQCLRLPSTPGV